MNKRKRKSKPPDTYYKNLKASDYLNISSRKDKSKRKKFGTLPEGFAGIICHLRAFLRFQ